LGKTVNDEQGLLRVCLTLNEAGEFSCTSVPLGVAAKEWFFAISEKRVSSTDILLQHKTNWRELYESEYATCGADEVIFLNECGEITEGSRTNIFVQMDGQLFTPPLSCGLLNGCLRAEMLAENKCEERVLMPDDLARAEKIYLGNSLRGLILATLQAAQK
jgi:branched-subunit amino acid aminotransferase/4-amino-4-deoxychorismate lyase